MRRITPLFIFPVIALFFLASCSKPIDRETHVKRLVGKYVDSIPEAYKEGNFNPLLKVAAGRAVSVIDNSYMAYLKGSGILLDSEFLGLEFDDIRLGSEADAERLVVVWHEADSEWREEYIYKETFVDTTERWRYKWVDAKTGDPASPIMTVKYRIAYTIDEVGGELKVISTKIVEEEVLKSEDTGVEWRQMEGGLAAAH